LLAEHIGRLRAGHARTENVQLMKGRAWRWSGSIALAALALASTSPTSAEEAAVKAQHGDWQLVCKRPEGAKSDLCALVQDVTSESNPNIGLSVQFQKGSDGEKVLRVFAPLGVLLPPGLGLQIDNDKVGHAPFVRCQVVGCVAQVTLGPDLIKKFRAGKTAWFIVFQTKEAGIGIPVSLEGFPKAIDSLP
jgi:invasion protein IalB